MVNIDGHEIQELEFPPPKHQVQVRMNSPNILVVVPGLAAQAQRGEIRIRSTRLGIVVCFINNVRIVTFLQQEQRRESRRLRGIVFLIAI